MALSDFDQAARYLIKLDPGMTLQWIMPNLDVDLQFRRWLETQSISFPGEAERRCDTVMELVSATGTQPPWALILDSQTKPDPSMLARLLEYYALLLRLLRHGPYEKDKYAIGAALLNLTGPPQQAEMTSELPGVPEVRLQFRVQTLTLERMSAEDHLQLVEEKKAWVVLPWMALMQGGTEDTNLQKWESLAKQEPDHKRRSDLGSITRIFAQLRPEPERWETLLKEWNVEQSTFLREWMAKGEEKGREEGREEGETRGKREVLLRLLGHRTDPLPEELAARINAEENVHQLDQWLDIAMETSSLEEFRTRANL